MCGYASGVTMPRKKLVDKHKDRINTKKLIKSFTNNKIVLKKKK